MGKNIIVIIALIIICCAIIEIYNKGIIGKTENEIIENNSSEIEEVNMIIEENLVNTKEENVVNTIENTKKENVVNETEKTKNTIVENKITENKNTETDVKNVDNYASSMSWSTYDAPGIEIQYPTEWKLEEIGNSRRGMRPGSISTVISGIATGINKETNTIINSDVKFEIYEPENVEGDYYSEETLYNFIYDKLGSKPTGAGYSDNKGNMTWYLVQTSNPMKWIYVHKEPSSHSERFILYRIDIETNNSENFKVTNILNRFFANYKITSYPDY